MSSSQQACDDGGGDRVVAAAGAQRGDLAFVVAPRVADLVGRASVGWRSWAWRCRSCGLLLAWATTARRARARDRLAMKRAVMGVPSKCSTRHQPGRIDVELVDQQGAHLARRGSARPRTRGRARARNCATLSGNGKGAQPQRVEVDAAFGQRLQRLVHGRAGGAEVDHAQVASSRRPAAAPAAAPAWPRSRTSSAAAPCCRCSRARARNSAHRRRASCRG